MRSVTFSIVTLDATTPRIMSLSIIALSMRTLSIVVFNIKKIKNATLSTGLYASRLFYGATTLSQASLNIMT